MSEEQILKLCKQILASKKIFASCFYGPETYAYSARKFGMHVMLVVSNYSPKIDNFNRQIGDGNFSILVVDKKVFEKDVEEGAFGEFSAEIIAFPYNSWINKSYMKKMEVKMKKRFILELLENIVLQYPELSTELLIMPEYFMYEVIRRRTKLFPPLIYNFFNMFNEKVRKQNAQSVMAGYLTALEELEKENSVSRFNGYAKIKKDFIEKTKRKRTKLTDIMISIRKALLPYSKGISSILNMALQQEQKLFAKKAPKRTEMEMLRKLEETERYLLMPTPLGLIPLSDKTTIQDFVRKTVPGGEALSITIEEMGGVLNSVFLLLLQQNNDTKKIVVKKFEDWLGFKWFPLAIWTLGTHSFAVLGETRMEREYSINQFLKKHGFAVPNILYVSLQERLIFKDFVAGEKVSETVKRVITSSKSSAEDSEIIKKVGREIAKAHLLGVSLGDCKPENMLVADNRDICFLDLEQAARNGNQPWDIAEFLYYSGHYILPTQSDEAAKTIAIAFLDGYLEGGGKKENITKAASAKYTKVFSIFTLPHIILLISNICKKMGRGK